MNCDKDMLPKIKAVIVDDEDLARKDLKAVLGDFNEIKVTGEADSVSSAVELINKLKPDLVFLDIQLTGELGFEVLDKITASPEIVFVTAYDKYAIRAFEVNARDYLLKPVNPERAARTIERLKNPKQDIPAFNKLSYEDVIFLSVNNKNRFLRIDSITAITAAADYTEVVTSDGPKGITPKTMKEWELRLPDSHFVRIHRSTIINTGHIEKVEDWLNYSYRIYLKGIAKPFIMSRRYAAKLKHELK